MSVEGLARSLDSPRSPVEGGRGLLAPLADSAHRGAGRQARLIQGRVGIIVALRLEPRLPGSGPRAAPASDGVGGRGGWGDRDSCGTRRGFGGRAGACAVSWAASRGGSAAAAAGAGVGEDAVVAPVPQLAAGLTPSLALCVQELAALPLLSP